MAARHVRDEHEHGDAPARVEAILAILRAAGGRVTGGRRAIVEALYAAGDHHLTAEAVAGAVQADHPEVHRSTVYRTLESLEELGVVTRVAMGEGPVVFHLADHGHHHLRCERCGTVVEIPEATVAPLARRLRKERGFALAPSHLVLPGTCADCATPDR